MKRNGFTLVELLVVIGILVLLTGMIVWGVASTRSTDKARSAARTAQSAFLGARDRAVHAKERRGIRLIRSPDATPGGWQYATGFEWIRPLPPQDFGGDPTSSLIQVERTNNGTGPAIVVYGVFGCDQWLQWWNDGVLTTQSRVRIPAATGQWYSVAGVTTGSATNYGTRPALLLGSPLPDFDAGQGPPAPIAVLPSSTLATCKIDLGNEMIPLTEPVSLPSGVVVDLHNSHVPGLTPAQMDEPNRVVELMFTPRGNVTGPVSVGGPVYFLLSDLQDVAAQLPLLNQKARGEKLILAVFPQTGNVQTFPIDPTDANNDGMADDLFRFARLGSAAQ